MADLSTLTAIAITVQSSPGTYNAPTTADVVPCANLRPSFDPITFDNPEYLGTVHRPGTVVLGKTVSLTFQIMLRGPGGLNPPAAGVFIPGRVLRAASFTENLISAAIPVAPEALGAGSTTINAVLGTSAGTTDDIYKGFALWLASSGTIAQKTLSQIVSYTGTGKVAAIAELLASAPTGNYQIPKQLAYQLSTGTPPVLSVSFWLGSRRFNCVDMAVSALRFNFPVTSREGADAPTMEVTVTGDLFSYIDENCPTVPALGAIPSFRDGKLHVNRVAVGGSSVSADMGLQVGFPPNPNKSGGNDPAQVTETRRTLSIALNQTTKAAQDLIALADGQGVFPIALQFGITAGNSVFFNVPRGRANYASPDPSGNFVTNTFDVFVDDADKAFNLVFPYW